MSERARQLAIKLLDYSTEIKEGEKILIQAVGTRTYPFVEALVEEAYARKALPYVTLRDEFVERALLRGGSEKQFQFQADLELARMKEMDVFIGVRGSSNVLENSDVPPEGLQAYSSTVMKQVHMECRVPDTRWVVMRWPSPAFAQSAKMSTRAFEDFFFKCCLLDYSKMSKAMDPLVALMDRTDKVAIKGPGTDLTFSIKGLTSVKCDGKLNIPDGEVFTAPVKDSVNGVLQYNTPTLYEGTLFDGVRLVFKDGKIVEESCQVGDADKLKSIFDRDDGSRYIGEFAIGVNPYVTEPMLDILFDEKIAGSFHFTPGGCYDEADNGNKSSVHWDMVCRQFESNGGGEIWFDDVLIRKDGMFVTDELIPLNPEELLK